MDNQTQKTKWYKKLNKLKKRYEDSAIIDGINTIIKVSEIFADEYKWIGKIWLRLPKTRSEEFFLIIEIPSTNITIGRRRTISAFGLTLGSVLDINLRATPFSGILSDPMPGSVIIR